MDLLLKPTLDKSWSMLRFVLDSVGTTVDQPIVYTCDICIDNQLSHDATHKSWRVKCFFPRSKRAGRRLTRWITGIGGHGPVGALIFRVSDVDRFWAYLMEKGF
jgi:hypothetical protein